MAKPFAQQAGSGMHIHVSVNDAAGNKIFASDDPEGTPALRHAIGGMIGSVGDGFAIFAPHANSYRRFKANSYAPSRRPGGSTTAPYPYIGRASSRERVSHYV